jgi:cyclic-di-AMP phosphodiesterase PgpH
MSRRIKDLRSPLTEVRTRLFETIARPFRLLSDNQRFWLLFAILCLATAVLIQSPFGEYGRDDVYSVGDVARAAIVSPADINTSDDAAAERQREAARGSIRPVFRYEANRADQAVQGFVSAWEDLQRRLAAGRQKTANIDAKPDVSWSGAGGPESGKIFAARTFSRNELEGVESSLRDSASGFIYDDAERQFFENEVVVFDRSRPNLRTTVSMPESNWTALSTARQRLRDRIKLITSLSSRESEAFYSATSMLVEPSVSYDSVATESARRAAIEQLQPPTIVLKRGQRVVDAGEVITQDTLAKVNAIRAHTSWGSESGRFAAVLLLVTALYWAGWRFVRNRGVLPRLALSAPKTFALLGFVALVQTTIVTLMFAVFEITALQSFRAPFNDPALWSFAVPLASASLITALLADRPTALVTGLITSLFAGMMAPRGMETVLYGAAVSSVAAYGIGSYRSRQTVTIAGAVIGVAAAVVGIGLIPFTRQPFTLDTVLFTVACGLASGVITAAVTAAVLPVCETVFGILTDVKLLELSNADLPVLGQLALRAPGTNQHSHSVAQLAEDACRLVGGNALLARIGALYHDIGKTAAPEHFVENQAGENPHDRLKPAQSAKIIISHVTYGTKLARELGLPARIVDFIPQHHGTRTLHYFLKKAEAASHPDEVVDENDFRYPGPKPQFKEAAIMMIADSCEAAARSLEQPTPENIRFIVTRILDAIVADDQLDECDLTLRELTQIRESMIRSLVAIYHSRVDYPGFVPPSGDGEQPDPVAGAGKAFKFSDPADIPVSPGGEIEDEAFDRSEQPNLGARRANR